MYLVLCFIHWPFYVDVMTMNGNWAVLTAYYVLTGYYIVVFSKITFQKAVVILNVSSKEWWLQNWKGLVLKLGISCQIM